MEGLAFLVSESLARHGVEAGIDHRRLQWSKWFSCESSFSVLLVPGKPGLYVLGEEVAAPGQMAAAGGKRMLAVIEVSETEDLGLALGRMFLPGNPLLRRLLTGRCFARYAVIEDTAQRASAFSALQNWMASSSEAASGLSPEAAFHE